MCAGKTTKKKTSTAQGGVSKRRPRIGRGSELLLKYIQRKHKKNRKRRKCDAEMQFKEEEGRESTKEWELDKEYAIEALIDALENDLRGEYIFTGNHRPRARHSSDFPLVFYACI